MSSIRKFRFFFAAFAAILLGVSGLAGAQAAPLHVISGSLPMALPMLKSGERAFVSEMRVIVPKLKRQKPERILPVGRAVCKAYSDNGVKPWVTSAIKSGFKGVVSPAAANLVISSATRNLCPRFSSPESANDVATAPTPTPTPTPTRTPTPTKLVLPDNSGWGLEGTSLSGYLTASATIGTVLPLGNAASLGISFYGITCSGEWYESGFVGVEFLDQNGAVIPTIIGTPTHLFGYSAGRSDFNSSGCGGETLNLKDLPTATSVRIVSDSGRNGSVSLFAGRFL
jgi:hypothetical protein